MSDLLKAALKNNAKAKPPSIKSWSIIEYNMEEEDSCDEEEEAKDSYS